MTSRSFQAVQPPMIEPQDSVSTIRDRLAAWMSSAPVSAVVTEFGGEPLDRGRPLTGEVERLVAFSDEWDFRARTAEERGLPTVERDGVNKPTFGTDRDELVREAARALAMVEETSPRHRHYDHVLILGGLVRACLLRPRHAAALLDSGIRAGDVAAIGAFRPLGERERALVRDADVGHFADEFDAMDAGVRSAFTLGEPDSVAGERDGEDERRHWEVREYRTPAGMPVRVVAAPSTEPDRRANTPDTYAYWAENLVKVAPDDRILLVTSTIYVPFQHTHAIRMIGLPYGSRVETVGIDVERASPPLRQPFGPSDFLQEIRSMFLAVRLLLEALPA